MDKYARQDRGDISEYEAYFAGMDASMQQKIALTTAHFPARGRIADMGSGSGSGTFDLARLYLELELVGVDINPVTVAYSNAHYRAENLKFAVGDIADRVFPDNSLDGILDSSVLHHVTSFNGFDAERIAVTIKNQVAQLKPGGVLIIRDFVVPDDAEKSVFLDLPETDGTASGEIAALSTAALFEVFARDFRSSLNLHGPVEFAARDSPRPGFARFETTLRTAAEFVLRKDYRDHWAPELLEEYTYYSQADFTGNFRKENLRIVVAMPLWNPWIVENRFRDKFYLSDAAGAPLIYPPTNFLIVGEKVGSDDGIRLSETVREAEISKAENPAPRPAFLKLKAYRHRASGRIYELAERPNRTIDLLPWFTTENGQLFVVAKKDFPRPIVNAESGRKNLSGAEYSGYLTEPISAIAEAGDGSPDARPAIFEILRKRAGLSETEITGIGEPHFYYTSPGGIDERVESFPVEIAGWNKAPHQIENYTSFKSAGAVRELDALQVLRASHVGGMFDARLEINIYRLLRKLNRSAGAWIGAEIRPSAQNSVLRALLPERLTGETAAAFEPVVTDEHKFLRLAESEFVETDAGGRIIGRAAFEYVVPRELSANTVAAIPFFQTAGGAVLVGVERRDLPAPQRFTENSRILCVPAWRLPRSIEHKFDLEHFLRLKFPLDFRVSVKSCRELGGGYLTSAGITPEVVYPAAVEIDAENAGDTDLEFFHLNDLLENSDKIEDAHFLILLNRLGHALGPRPPK